MQQKNFERLYFYENGKVYLQLDNDTRLLFLGCIVDNELIVYKKQKDIFRLNNSFAFNNNLIKNGDFEILHIIYERKIHYYLSREEALTLGRLMHFKKQGQELQIFVSISLFHKSKDEVILRYNAQFSNASSTKPQQFTKSNDTQLLLFS
ncbi:MAG: hypothetical protein L0Y77_10605 [Chlorobi bacterium]|nr:hypothetical protein [Chlorobiota bacterium]